MSHTSPLRILVVDDSRAMRHFISRVIGLAGLQNSQIVEASDGEEALRHVASEPPDLILTDINMPGMDGEAFLRAVSSVAPQIPTVVISSDGTDERRSRMLALGASGYLAKPFSPELLARELDRLILAGIIAGGVAC